MTNTRHTTKNVLVSCYYLALFHVHLVSMEDRCRTLQFKEVLRDKAFTKNITKSLIVKDEDQCQVKCYMEATCKSYNLGPPRQGLSGNEEHVCELSSSRHVFSPDDLESRPGFIYRPSVNLCGVPCPEKQSCFPSTSGGFSCLCPDPGFTGQACDQDIDECAANMHDCAADANCTNKPGSYMCTCQEGYQGDGKTCQDKDECEEGDHICVSPAVCINEAGSYTCWCPPKTVRVDSKECIGFPFHWIFDGTDKHLSLRGAARYEEQDGRTVLYLDGSAGTYAETLPTPIHNTNLTIAVWIKLMPYSGEQTIYGDWSNPWPFRLYIHTNGRLCGQTRNVNGADLFGNGCTGSSDVLPINVWSHVAMTWGLPDGTVRTYINGEMKWDNTVVDISNLEFKNSGHPVYDIGLKRDSGSTTHAYFSDLMMFSREFQFSPAENINEIKNDLVLNHPLYR